MESITQEQLDEMIAKRHRHFENVLIEGLRFPRFLMLPMSFTNCKILSTDFGACNMRIAIFIGCDIENCDFSGADLTASQFIRTKLVCPLFESANMVRATLDDCQVEQENMSAANLHNIKVAKTKLSPRTEAMLSVIPSDGDVIGWKQCYSADYETLIVKLLIRDGVRRSAASTRKCRSESAEVLDIQLPDGTPYEGHAYSMYNTNFKYMKGQIVTADSFHPDRWLECAGGIHFFITRQEAVDYVY